VGGAVQEEECYCLTSCYFFTVLQTSLLCNFAIAYFNLRLLQKNHIAFF
jgi:hypothetical protein